MLAGLRAKELVGPEVKEDEPQREGKALLNSFQMQIQELFIIADCEDSSAKFLRAEAEYFW